MTQPFDATTLLHYDMNGFHAAVAVADPQTRAAVRHSLIGFAPVEETIGADATHYALVRDADGEWTVSKNSTSVYQTSTLADALMSLEWHLVTDMLAYRGDLFHLHGAALLAPGGVSSILILGASGSGKTTLTLGLMARGFLPYADDVSLIEPTTLEPQTLRRTFHVDAQTRALVEQLPAPPTWDYDAAPPGCFLPPAWADHPAPIRFVLFPTLRPDAVPTITRLTVPGSVAALLPFSTTLGNDPAFALSVAARLTAQASCFDLSTGDLDATVRLITRLVETESDTP